MNLLSPILAVVFGLSVGECVLAMESSEDILERLSFNSNPLF